MCSQIKSHRKSFLPCSKITSIKSNSSTAVSSPYLLSSGKYEHVVCTIDSTTSTNNVVLYVSGLGVATGSIAFSPGLSGAHPPFRMFSSTSSTSEIVANGVGGHGVNIGEAFIIRRLLTPQEVSGIYVSGFIDGSAPITSSGMNNSDLNDTQKDNLGAQTSTTSNIIINAWKNTELANPSGVRHATSGFHPAFIKVLGNGASSGLTFNSLQGTASGIAVLSFRNATTGTVISGMKIWMDTSSALPSSGWNVSFHVNSAWLPNLTLPSGSGIIGKSLGAASSVLRSDLNTTISGYSLDGTVQSGEYEISQYIYLGFTTDSEFTPGTYGPNGISFRISANNV